MDFANSSGIKSPFSPRVRQSITGRRPVGHSAKKTPSKFIQSHGEQTGEVIYKTPSATIETYGMPLPVMVTEALTFAVGPVSARVSGSGWCWLVAARRVLAWPLPSAAATAPAARDLTLPQTDLAHKADLVVIFYQDSAQMPSCIGVSPEGTARYWPSIAGAACADVSCELAGQEAVRLSEPCAGALLLATTSGTRLLLRPASIDGRATLSCRTLSPSAGWLGGLGRRVSTLFFGSMQPHSDTKVVSIVVVQEGELLEPMTPASPASPTSPAGAGSGASGCVALLSSGGLLSLWSGELHDHDLRDLLPRGETHGTELMALDMAAGSERDSLLVLLAAGLQRNELKYALAHVSVSEPWRPRVLWLRWLRPAAASAAAAAGCGHEQPRLLPLPAAALLYTRHRLALHRGAALDEPAEVVDVSADGDRVLAAAACDNGAVLLSARHGLLLLRHAPSSCCDSPPGGMGAVGTNLADMDGETSLALYEIDPHEVSRSTTDACGKLKTAFLFHVRRDATAAAALLHELFPQPQSQSQPQMVDVDAVLDRTVMAVATEMLEDMPAGDPRWQRSAGPATAVPLGASSALQIAAQLRDKRRAFTLYADFLRAAGLWQRLGRLSAEEGDGSESTALRLRELCECVAAACALRDLQQGEHAQRDQPLIDSALHQAVLSGRWANYEQPAVLAALDSGALTAADAGYRLVPRVRLVLLALLSGASGPRAAAAASIMQTVMREMARARSAWDARMGGPPDLPDNARTGGQADLPNVEQPSRATRELLTACAAFINQALTQASGQCADAARAQLHSACGELCDALLAALGAAGAARWTEPLRAAALQPFMCSGLEGRATALAEKYGAVEQLVELCVRGEDLGRLYRYCDLYEKQGLAETAYARLCSSGAGAARLIRSATGAQRARLSRWLQAAEHRAPLLVLLQLCAAEHAAAALSTLQLARRTTACLHSGTTMASIAKLCALASDDEATAQAADERLSLAAAHDALPRAIRTRHAIGGAGTRLHDPHELVQMYIEGADAGLTEYDYKNALDLTDRIDDRALRDQLRLKVWCACILEDDWSRTEEEGPGSTLRDLMFFRLIDLVHVMGGDVSSLVPSAERLLHATELSARAEDANFAHKLRQALQPLALH